jgi:hypothetical protein
VYRDAEDSLRREWEERAARYRRAAAEVPWHVRRVLVERAGRIGVGVAGVGVFIAFAVVRHGYVHGWTAWPTGILIASVPAFVCAGFLGSAIALVALTISLRGRARPTDDVRADLERLAVSPAEVAKRMARKLGGASLGLPAATYIVFCPLLVALALFAFFYFFVHVRLADFDPAIAVVVNDYGIAAMAVLVFSMLFRRGVMLALVFTLPAFVDRPVLSLVLVLFELLWMSAVVGHGNRVEKFEKQILI